MNNYTVSTSDIFWFWMSSRRTNTLINNFPPTSQEPEIVSGGHSIPCRSFVTLKLRQLGKHPSHLLTHPVGKGAAGHLREGSRVYGVGIGGRLLLVQGSDGGAQGGGFVVVVEEAEEGCFTHCLAFPSFVELDSGQMWANIPHNDCLPLLVRVEMEPPCIRHLHMPAKRALLTIGAAKYPSRAIIWVLKGYCRFGRCIAP
jgi:hypothetical protein